MDGKKKLHHLCVEQLFNRQMAAWPLAADNYRALAHVETRTLFIRGFPFTVQFNPARIASSTATIDPQKIQDRPCFLCRHHLPPEQEALPYTSQNENEYLILCNPFPISPRHFTITDVNHTDQLISGRIEDMLELAEQFSDYVLLYNGPKSGASAPDHFHFQAVSKGFLPIQTVVESGASIQNYPVPAIVFESEESASVAAAFHASVTQEPEPMLNLLCWKTGDKYYLVVFPRKLHRPSQYFATDESHILLSPGAIDLAGVVITPLEKDFRKLSEADVVNIIEQISIPPKHSSP